MAKEKIIPDRRQKVDRTKYIRVGITSFLVLAAVVLLVFIFVKSETVTGFFGNVKSALTPVLYGAIFAFLLTPVVNFFEKPFTHAFTKHAKKISRARKLAQILSIVLTLVLAIAVITAVVYLIAPEVINTVSLMVDELPGQVDHFLEWIQSFNQDNSTLGTAIQKVIATATAYAEDFIQNELVAKIADIAQYLLTGVWDVVNVVYNVVIGFVFSIYVLCSREKFAAQAKKLAYAFMRRKSANTLIRLAKQTYHIFSGAIIGKVIDSAIIGLICFVGMSVLNMPYAVLIATFVGVTNVIPFFGPYIGAIPSALLILFVDPLKCLYFIIFILLLQQFDCNILDPKIVGGNIGISAFWVLFACVFFGGLFGLPGLLLGVPSFASIYMIVKEIVEKRLKKKGLMTATEDYNGVDSLPEQELVLVTVPGTESADANENNTESAEQKAAEANNAEADSETEAKKEQDGEKEAETSQESKTGKIKEKLRKRFKEHNNE